jgi:hypothetical protein
MYPFIISSNVVIDFFPKANWTNRGVIGDSFGALNTLFSGLALAGLAISISLQTSQLRKLERKEDETAKHIAAQAEVLRHTALLTYYNNEVERLERLSHQVDNDNSEVAKKFWAKYQDIRSKRDIAVSSLNEINISSL